MLEVNHQHKSLNYAEIDIEHKYIVLHCMCMDDKEAIEYLCSPKSRVSSHYYIARDGVVYNLVDDSKQAWHAGFSMWKDDALLNNNSIGIELGNTGTLGQEGEYTPAQYNSLKVLLEELMNKYNISKEDVVAHSDISPDRKTDPGANFNWKYLIDNNLAVGFQHANLSPLQALESFGYCLKYRETDVITAFQRRFTPDNITGEIDETTKQFLEK